MGWSLINAFTNLEEREEAARPGEETNESEPLSTPPRCPRREAPMIAPITIETASPRILAAVRRHVKVAEIPTAFAPALDGVRAFLRSQPGLRTDGHNVFLYHHATGDPENGMDVDFGVEVARLFQRAGQVFCVETPKGRTAVTVHRGPYRDIPEAHEALRRWIREHGERMGSWSWEIYGDPSDDGSKLETTIVYALSEAAQVS
jgi:effector-binding domain-containing protein